MGCFLDGYVKLLIWGKKKKSLCFHIYTVMSSEIGSLHLTHSLLRSIEQPFHSALGPDPELHQAADWKLTLKFMFLIVGKFGSPEGNPHRHRESNPGPSCCKVTVLTQVLWSWLLVCQHVHITWCAGRSINNSYHLFFCPLTRKKSPLWFQETNQYKKNELEIQFPVTKLEHF